MDGLENFHSFSFYFISVGCKYFALSLCKQANSFTKKKKKKLHWLESLGMILNENMANENGFSLIILSFSIKSSLSLTLFKWACYICKIFRKRAIHSNLVLRTKTRHTIFLSILFSFGFFPLANASSVSRLNIFSTKKKRENFHFERWNNLYKFKLTISLAWTSALLVHFSFWSIFSSFHIFHKIVTLRFSQTILFLNYGEMNKTKKKEKLSIRCGNGIWMISERMKNGKNDNDNETTK